MYYLLFQQTHSQAGDDGCVKMEMTVGVRVTLVFRCGVQQQKTLTSKNHLF